MLRLIIVISSLFLSWNIFAAETFPLSIQAITSIVDPASSTPGKNFSLNIKFIANKTISNWALGFYMPRNLKQLINRNANIQINPDLSMEICNLAIPSQCNNLYYVRKLHPYTSAGYTHILAPIDNVSLKSGNTYIIKINKSNQGAPTNYSAMPQNFFLIANKNNISRIPEVLPEQYQIGNYDEKQILAAIKQHHRDNWEKSKPLTPNNIADKFHLVPTPVSIRLLNQKGFEFISNETIALTNEFVRDQLNKKILSLFLKQDLNINLTEKTKPTIIIKKTKTSNPEGYQLQIENNNIIISASSNAGVFYAIQTLRQLWHQKKSLPGMIIKDYPRFPYRGFLVDVSRHFFTVAEIEKLIDAMSVLKLNTLHVHFADDEGWRIDLGNNSKDPLTQLIKIGANRGFVKGSVLQPAVFIQANLDLSNRENFSSTGKIIQANYHKADEYYAGYYSKNDIKTLIDYANERQITIIPEIDLPGHARALIYAMPNIFKDKNDKSEYSGAQGYTDNIIPVCLYNEKSLQAKKFTNTIDEVIKRINQLFANQSTIYHSNEVSLAGDEVSSQAWSNDASCKGLWSSLSALDKSHYFFSLLTQKSPLLLSGWQQLVQNDDGSIGSRVLSAKQVAHVWVWEKTGSGNNQKGIKDAAILANAGYRTVLAFGDDTYFDLTYTPDKWEPGFKWGGNYLDTNAALRSAFDSLKTTKLIHANKKNNLLGIEGALWTENIANFPHLIYMVMPKMTGLAEAAWASTDASTTPDGKLNWKSLSYRLGFAKYGFLTYFYRISHLKYRGYPHGILHEIPFP